MDKIILTGNDLTRHQVIDVAYNHARVEINKSALANSLNFINAVAGKKIVYSITTGFGSNADKPIPLDKAIELQVNLLRSHACGIGNPFSKEIVRAIMVIRLNTLLRGNSGVQESTVDQLAFLLNNDIHPVIPEQGSVGASGDLCPLSHMALPLIGEGDLEFQGNIYENLNPKEKDDATSSYSKFILAFKKYADEYNSNIKEGEENISYFSPCPLSYKEGLALNNGTTVMTAVGTLALHKSEQLLKICTLSSALIFESLCARSDSFAFDPIHIARNHAGQTEIAKWLKKILNGSKLINMSQKEILAKLIKENKIPNGILAEIIAINAIEAEDEQVQVPSLAIDKMKAEGMSELANMLTFAKKKWKPQDSYSIRCLPQVLGASKKAIDHVISVVDNELNASVDNPLIFSEDGINGNVVSGGNFHGQPIALVMDYLKLALAEMGNITERQINKMVDAATNDCLDSFLVYGNGVVSGLMIPQYAAAGVVSENKVLVHPASADSIPTCENTEDHVSMGTIAARQALQIAENVEKITAIAIMTGFYAISMRLEQFATMEMECSPDKTLAPATLDFYNTIKKSNKEFQRKAKSKENDGYLQTDRYLSPEIKRILANFGEFVAVAEKYLK